MVTLDERIERAMQLRARGLNCSQCVVGAFTDNPEHLRMAMGLGGGVAGMKQTCGCITAMALIDGLLAPEAPKAECYRRIRKMADAFDRKNGSTVCYKLKEVLHRPCNELIKDAVTVLHRRFDNPETSEE